MKKLLAMLLTLALVLCACAATAEVMRLPGTKLTLDIGELEELALTEEDLEDDVVLAFANDEETLEGVVYVFRSDIDSVSEFEEILADEEGVEISGYTTINNVETYFQVQTVNGDNYVAYYTVDSGRVVQFVFWYADEDAAMLSGVVMGTLMATK